MLIAATSVFRSVADETRRILRHPEAVTFLIVMTVTLLLGGWSKHDFTLDFIVQVTAFIAFLAILLRGWWWPYSQLPWHALLLIGGILALLILHLVPLPPGIWEALPGRGLAVEVLEQAGLAGRWHSLSLVPDETRFTALAILPALTGFSLMLAVPERLIRPLLAAVLIVIFISAAIGMFQVASAGILFPFYGNFYAGMSNGLMANHNHQADLLTIGMLLLLLWRKREGRKGVSAPLLLALGAILVASVLATQSRAGLAVALLALLAESVFLFRDVEKRGKRKRRSVRKERQWKMQIVAAIGAVVALPFGLYLASMRVRHVVARYMYSGEDLRPEIWATAFRAVKAYFPVGSGLGSFDQVYVVHETLDLLGPTTANAAHNDYLELLFTGGIPALLLIALLIAVMVLSVRNFWALPHTAGQVDLVFVAVAGMTVLLLHSLVDYPLQTHALSFLFACFLALLIRLGYFPERSKREVDQANKYG